MEIVFVMLALFGFACLGVVGYLIYDAIKPTPSKTKQFEWLDNKRFLEVSAIRYKSERDARANEFHQEVIAASEECSRPELWSMGPIRIVSPSSGATITAQHYTYPETLKPAQTHCKFCGNNFVPDKFGRCSSCGGPQQ